MVAAFSILLSGSAEAALITGSASDFEPRIRTGGTQTAEGPYDPGPSKTAAALRTGQQLNFQISSAYFFKLPDVVPGVITGANLVITGVPEASTGIQPTFNADLVALGFTNADPPSNLTADSQRYFFFGAQGATDAAAGENGADRQLIQDDFFVPADFVAPGGAAVAKGTSDTGDATLLGYIQELYANPSFVPGSSYLILRLNADGAAANASTAMRYNTAAAEHVTAEARPVLDLTIVPEPATAGALALLGALTLLRRK
jgi:hypothetical protein